VYVQLGRRAELVNFPDDWKPVGDRHVDHLGSGHGQQFGGEPDAERHRCADAVFGANVAGSRRAGSSRPSGG